MHTMGFSRTDCFSRVRVAWDLPTGTSIIPNALRIWRIIIIVHMSGLVRALIGRIGH